MPAKVRHGSAPRATTCRTCRFIRSSPGRPALHGRQGSMRRARRHTACIRFGCSTPSNRTTSRTSPETSRYDHPPGPPSPKNHAATQACPVMPESHAAFGDPDHVCAHTQRRSPEAEVGLPGSLLTTTDATPSQSSIVVCPPQIVAAHTPHISSAAWRSASERPLSRASRHDCGTSCPPLALELGSVRLPTWSHAPGPPVRATAACEREDNQPERPAGNGVPVC